MAHPRLSAHITNPANDKLVIEVQDQPGAGGANHRYHITGFDATDNPARWVGEESDRLTILFQNGPIAEAGVNGITQEALLAVLIHRLEAFQAGPFANPYNEGALMHLRCALAALASRTRERMDRGVEGKNEV